MEKYLVRFKQLVGDDPELNGTVYRKVTVTAESEDKAKDVARKRIGKGWQFVSVRKLFQYGR